MKIYLVGGKHKVNYDGAVNVCAEDKLTAPDAAGGRGQAEGAVSRARDVHCVHQASVTT